MLRDDERPFPFDLETELFYKAEYWRCRSGIAQYAQVLFLDAEDRIAVLAFYSDGSGEHGKGTSKAFVVAGYLANTIDWFEIERHWTAELAAPPTIKYFKARECVRHQGDFSGEFKGWPEREVLRKRQRLAEIVWRHSDRMVAISSSIRWDEYESIIGTDVAKQVFYSPYLFCFHGVSSLAAEQSLVEFRDHPGRIAFIFDTEGKRLDADVGRHYEAARNHLPQPLAERLGSLIPDTDVRLPVLQIADLLVWSIRSKLEGFASPVLNLILDPNRIAGAYERPWRSGGLAQFVIDIEDQARQGRSDHTPE